MVRFGATSGFVRSHRVAIASWAALSVFAACLTFYALHSTGYPVHKPDLDDGGIWVTNQAWGTLGRENRPVAQLDGVVWPGDQPIPEENAGIDVLQNGAAVLSVNRTSRTVTPVDVTMSQQLTDDAVTVKDDRVVLGGDTAGVTEARTGRVWLTHIDPSAGVTDVSALSGTAKPLATVGGDATLTVGTDGTAYVVGGERGTLTTIAPQGAGFASPTTTSLKPAVDGKVTGVTAVGHHVAVLDDQGTLGVDGTRAGVGKGAVVQQPGPDSSSVLAATPSALLSVDRGSGRVTTVAKAAGAPSQPVRLQDCVFGAWAAGGTGTVVTQCGDDPARTGTIADLEPSPDLVFRVNRGQVVLNDMRNGDVWAVDGAHPELISNWEAFQPKKQDKDNNKKQLTQQTRATQKPQARDDDLGVRPGRTTVLHVLDNDSSAAGSILSVVSLTSADQPGVKVTIAPDRQSVLATVDDAAVGKQPSFSYTVDDGTPNKAGQDDATVHLTVRGDDGSGQPTLREHYTPTTYAVAAGGTVEVPVVGDWRDKTYGDPVTLQQPKASTGDATVSPDGLLRYTAAPGRSGVQTVTYDVSTGGPTASGKVNVDVVSDKQLVSPKAENDVAEGAQGSWITVRPLDNDVPGADPSNLDAELVLAGDVPPKGGLEVQTDRDTGVVRIRGRVPGTYTLTYSAGFGAATPATARIRVDVAPASQASNEPIATPDTSAVQGTATRTVDVLANDYDARGRMLVVTHAEPVDPDGALRVAVIDGRWLRVSATQDDMSPTTQAIRYTISNGDADATGSLTVTQRPPLRGASDAPDAVTDEATVRAGDSVDVPVLDNDSTPSGDPVALVVDDTVKPAGHLQILPQPAQGAAYVDGTRVRYVAPESVRGPTDVDVRYVVANTGDPTAERSSGTIHVHITPPPKTPADDQVPTPQALEGRVVQGDVVTVKLPTVGSDPDGDSVSITGIDSAPKLGRVLSYGANAITYQAFPQSAGTDEFSYEVADTFGRSATGTVRIGVVPPGAPQNPVAVDDSVTLDPQRRLTFDVLANDLRTPGTQLHAEPLDHAPDGVRLDESTGVMTVGPRSGQRFLHVPYRATTGLADDGAELSIRYRKGFDNPPTAGTVIAHPEGASASVTVDVLGKVSDIDDSLEHLRIDQVTGPPGAAARPPRPTADGKVTLPVARTTTVWTYRVTDSAGAQAVGTIYVPARPTNTPYLRPGSVIHIDPGATAKVDIRDYVADPEGDPVVLTTKEQIGTAPADMLTTGATTATTIELTAGKQDGMGSLSFQVSDRSDLSAKDAHLAVLTVPVQVGDPEPKVNCPTTPIQVPESGVSALIDVAAVCHVWTADPAQAASLTYTGTLERGLSGVSVTPRGSDLQLDATGARAGAHGALDIHVRGYHSTSKLYIEVVKLPPPTLDPVRPIQTEAGKPVRIDLAAGYLNSPIPPAKRDVVVTDVVPVGNAPDMASTNGSVIDFTPPAQGHGDYRYHVAVSDSGDHSSRVRAVGVIEVDVLDVPGQPTGLVTTSDFLSNVVMLQWHAPADNGGDPIQHYEVQADGHTVQSCPATTCRITGLDNGHDYTFRVRAVNSVGSSREWSNSARGEPDAYTGRVLDLAVNLQRDHRVTLHWSAPARCDCSAVRKYRVSWPGGGLHDVAAPTTTYVASVGSNGDPITFTVVPLNDKGVKTGDGPRATVVGMGAGKPDTPARPTIDWTNRADNSGKAVTISWGPVAPNGPSPVTYTVHRTGGGAAKDVCTWVQATSCQDDVSNNGAIYSYTVKARNAEADSANERRAGGSALHISGTSGPATIEAAAPPDAVRINGFNATGQDGQATLHFDVGASHGKQNTVSCTVNGGSCGTWSYPVAGQGNVTKTLTGLPDGQTSTVHLVACNGSGGGTGAGSACGPDSSASTVTYGPIGTPSLSLSASGNTITWNASVDPNGKAATVTVTRNGSTIYSASTGTGTFSHSATDTLSYDTSYTYKLTVSDSSRASRSTSASAKTWPKPTIALSKGTQFNNANCVDPSCARLHLHLSNFTSTQTCIPHSDHPEKPGEEWHTKDLAANFNDDTLWFFGYPGYHVWVTCSNGSYTSNTITW